MKKRVFRRWIDTLARLATSSTLAISLSFSPLLAQTAMPKKGGVYFRVDDDHQAWQYRQYDSLFNNYGLKYTLAINIARPALTPEAIAFLRGAQSHGQEIMDHTPDHATQFFQYVVDTAYYSGRPGVDHINRDKICLAYTAVDTNGSVGSGFADISHDLVISRQNGAFAAFQQWPVGQIYFPTLSKLCDISSTEVRNSNSADVDSIQVLSPWDESIDLGIQRNVKYVILGVAGGRLTDDALRLLVERSLLLFSRAGLSAPVSWIQPGSFTPNIDRRDAARIFGEEYNYRSAATYWDYSLKVFNEYNPASDKRFSMEWGDFLEEIQSSSTMRSIIADRVAKHYVVSGHSHFDVEDWSGYIARIDSLLSWLVQSGIPVRTETQWADALYGATPDPSENIIPPLNVDLDENGVPDGYVNSDGVFDRTDGVPSSEGCSYRINKVGHLCSISQLGGLEKGDNQFAIWIKGPIGSKVRVHFSNFSGKPYNAVQATFTARSTAWEKYTLSDATSGPVSISIPQDVSCCDVGFECDDANGGTVKISGMEMWKAGTPLPGALTLLQPLSGSTGQSVPITLQWQAASNANTYTLQVSTDSLFTSTIIHDSLIAATSGRVGLPNDSLRYFWRVRGRNGAGYGPWSAVWNFRTPLPKPGRPTLVLPVDGSTHQPITVHFAWEQVAWDEKNRLQVARDSSFKDMVVDSTLGLPSLDVMDLQFFQTYYWRVRAVNCDSSGDFSSIWHFTTTIPPPSNLRATVSNHRISLTWTYSVIPTLMRQRIFRSEGAGTLTIHDSTNGAVTSYIDSNLTNGTRYYYRVAAVDSDYVFSDFSNDAAGVPNNHPPKAQALRDVELPNVGRVSTSSVVFVDTASADPDGKIDSLFWYVNGRLVGTSHSLNYEFRQGTNFVQLVVMDNDGARDTSSARVSISAFKRYLGGPVYAGLSLFHNDILYAIASGDAVYRMDGNGNTQYTLKVGGLALSSSSISNDTTVYTTSSDGNLYGFSRTGIPVWPAIPLGGELSATCTVDSLSEGLYLGVENGNFVSIDREYGTVKWNFLTDSPIRSSAVITSSRKMVFASLKGTIYGIDLNGLRSEPKPSWILPTGDTITGSPAVDRDGYVYFCTWSGRVLKVKMPRHRQPGVVWEHRVGAGILGSPVIDNRGILYVGALDSNFYAIQTSSGSRVWVLRTSGAIRSTAAISPAGMIYMANDHGDILCIDSLGRTAWSYRDGSSISAPLLYGNGMVYVGTESGRIVALYDSDAALGTAIDESAAQWGTFQGNSMRTGMQELASTTVSPPEGVKIPQTYSLLQNYPNPFNPSTTIKYDLPRTTYVTLTVYDILGREVSVLVNDRSDPGVHEVKFDGSNLASGMYFYRIQAGDFAATKKLILLK